MASVPRPQGELRRTRADRMIGGVCAGLARYFGVDPVVVRVIFVVLALAEGAGVLLYLALLVVMPEETANVAPTTPGAGAPVAGATAADPPLPHEARRHRGVWAGLLLVILGAYLLVVNLGLFWWWDWTVGGPALLIAAGVLLLLRRLR